MPKNYEALMEAMNDEFDEGLMKAGRDIALTLVLKLLFGAMERQDPTFSGEVIRQTLVELVNGLTPPDARGLNKRIRAGATEFIDEVLKEEA